MLVRRAEMLPIECIVRGYLSGSAWKEYRTSADDARHAAARRAARVRPAPGAGVHALDEGDRGPRREHLLRRGGRPRRRPTPRDQARALCLAAYERGAARALERGIVIADTKFELGFIDGELAICDEILTPDSSPLLARECLGTRARRRPRSTSSRCGTGPRRPAGTRSRRRRRSRPRSSPRRATRYVAAYEQITGLSLRRLVGRGAAREVRRPSSRSRGLEGIADPEGQTIERALPALGFEGSSTCTSARSIRFRPRGARRGGRAGCRSTAMCERLLANPVIEQAAIRLEPLDRRPSAAMTHERASPSSSSPVRTASTTSPPPGSSLGGASRARLAHRDRRSATPTPSCCPAASPTATISGPGAIARFSPVMDAVARFAADGGPVARDLQRLPGADRGGPAPGALMPERGAAFPVRDRRVRGGLDRLGAHRPGAHSARCCACRSTTTRATTPATRRRSRARGRTARSCCAIGATTRTARSHAIAGVTNRERNVVGLMPHPERASDPLLGSADGRLLLESLLECFGSGRRSRGQRTSSVRTRCDASGPAVS